MNVNIRVVVPLVSVILPTFDRLEFLRAAIDSVIGQTHADWELVIADDGSTEETKAYLRALADPRVRVLWLAHSGKPSVARNAAIRTAQGRYLAFMDSDDVWLPRKLETQLGAMHGRPERRWSYTALSMIDIEGRAIPDEVYQTRHPYDGDVVERLLTLEALISTPTVMAERSLVGEVGGFDEELVVNEDQDLWLRLAMRSPVTHVADRLVRVRVKRPDPRYPQNPIGSGVGWVRLYEKAIVALKDPRLRAIARRQRARRALMLGRDLVLAGKYAEARRAAWDSLPYQWWGAAKVIIRASFPYATRDSGGHQLLPPAQ